MEENQGTAVIQVTKEGENAILLYGGSNKSVTPSYIDDVLNSFDKDTMVVLQNEISNVNDIIDKAYEKGMSIALNPSPVTKSICAVDFNKVSWLVVNEIEGALISGEEDSQKVLHKLSKQYPNTGIVLTKGKDGVEVVQSTNHYENKAYKTTVVDTTGAGDTFFGYFVAGIAQNMDIQSNIMRASMASAITVSGQGAAASIPKAPLVQEWLENQK